MRRHACPRALPGAILSLALTAIASAGAAGQDPRLAERDRFAQQTTRLRKEGKLREAVEACKRMLAIEREVLGETNEDVVGSALQLAQLYRDLGEVEAEQEWRRAVL